MRLFRKSVPALEPRTRNITSALNLVGKGVEYGPLHAALLRKPHYDVSYVDYADRTSLVQHYANDPNVDVSLIPEIDIVTGGKLISEFLPNESVDYIVASHVMEHVPDLLGWLEANLYVLKPGGRIAVAFPDKRYCFDLKRKSTMVSDLVAAYLEKRTMPSFQQICDHFWNISKANPVDCWNKTITAESSEYVMDRGSIFDVLIDLKNRGGYVDTHCWVFADFEFVQCMNSIRNIIKGSFDIVSYHPTQPNTLEFYVTLGRI
ncbi:class I SAM-dependent methyltransferase [Mesorhizobium sp. LNHC209A00]|uniref:methyltransferase domain-containing protein n=1 Tax=Mesorhizobium TaxID=68287 RepID=UPI000687E443|nr:class I SAM-dependent methyltransferase [Mesorhizobium sp. LNHC209A00]